MHNRITLATLKELDYKKRPNVKRKPLEGLIVDDDLLWIIDKFCWRMNGSLVTAFIPFPSELPGGILKYDVSLRCVIMGSPGTRVKVINGNPLDMRRENLRLDIPQLTFTNPRYVTYTSRLRDKFVARRFHKNHTFHLGIFDTFEEAHKVALEWKPPV